MRIDSLHLKGSFSISWVLIIRLTGSGGCDERRDQDDGRSHRLDAFKLKRIVITTTMVSLVSLCATTTGMKGSRHGEEDCPPCDAAAAARNQPRVPPHWTWFYNIVVVCTLSRQQHSNQQATHSDLCVGSLRMPVPPAHPR